MKKATQQQSKDHNKRLILKTIYTGGEVSRASLARHTYLTRTTVSSIVSELIQENLAEEIGLGTSEGGKPPVLLRFNDEARQLIGIDLANSRFQGALTDLRGRILHRHSLPVPEQDGQAALEIACELTDHLVAAATRPLLGIGIGAPGLMDARQGIILQAVNLRWSNLPLRELLTSRYQLPCYLVNDSHAAALGEYVFGPFRNVPNLIVMKVGRGISAGIVLNGQLYHGDGSGAGEMGHTVVVEHGEPCLCGNAGCLETVASTLAVVKKARLIARNNPSSALHRFAATPEAIDTETVLQAFQAGDPEVKQIIVEIGQTLGVAVANMVGLLNIQHILIGGSLARFGETLLQSIRQTMRLHAMPMLAEETQVDLSSLGQDIVIKGAAALLLANELGLV